MTRGSFGVGLFIIVTSIDRGKTVAFTSVFVAGLFCVS